MGNINTTVGVKTLKYGTADGTPQTAVDVYQDTCTFVEKDPTITEHKSETSAKKIVVKRKEGFELKFSIMDPTPAAIAAFCGGTANTDKGWKESEGSEQIALSLDVEPQQGLTLHIPNASIAAKLNTTFSSTGITLLEVTATPQKAVSYGTVTG